MLKGASNGFRNTENPDHSILAKEVALHHRHEEILAKRELLMQSRELLMKSKADQVQVTLGDWHQAKKRNEQLLWELDHIQQGLQRAAFSPDDATFIGLRDSYWKMVEKEHPQWLSYDKSRLLPSKHVAKH